MLFGFGRFGPSPPRRACRPAGSGPASGGFSPSGDGGDIEGGGPYTFLPPPELLLERAKSGDGQALGDLLALYENYLLLLSRLQIGKRLQVKIEPNDLIQETFLEASSGIVSFQGKTETEFVAWLRRIFAGVLSNQIRRYYGTKRRDVRLERELAQDVDRSSMILDRNFVARESSPSQHVTRREQAVRLADALNHLPEDYREVIILRQLEDLPFAEVAERMGRTENSVKNLWARALARLRRKMDDSR